jgi:hypothetical protein
VLEKKIAAYKFGIDSLGNYSILGLDETSFWKVQRDHSSGEYMLLHKFSAKGRYLGSFLPMPIDASSQDSRTRQFASPMHQPGNFAVSSSGDVWLLWFEFPPLGSESGISSRLFHVDPKGAFSQSKPQAPVSGCFIVGLVDHSESHGVLLEWRGGNSVGRIEAILASPDGVVFARGDYPGRVMSISDGEVITAVKGLVEGRLSVIVVPIR